MRQITVFGANGHIGSRIVALLLDKNYKVIAFVHKSHNFSAHPNLTVKQGDIYNAADIEEALSGSDCVISALGSWHTPNKNILASGMKHIIPTMEQQGIMRIISLTGAGAWDSTDTISILQKALHSGLSLVAPKILHDGEQHIRLLRASTLDWTVVRSPIMTEWGHKGDYALDMKLPNPFATIHRDDVVACMSDLVDSDEYIHSAPVIYRR